MPDIASPDIPKAPIVPDAPQAAVGPVVSPGQSPEGWVTSPIGQVSGVDAGAANSLAVESTDASKVAGLNPNEQDDHSKGDAVASDPVGTVQEGAVADLRPAVGDHLPVEGAPSEDQGEDASSDDDPVAEVIKTDEVVDGKPQADVNRDTMGAGGATLGQDVVVDSSTVVNQAVAKNDMAMWERAKHGLSGLLGRRSAQKTPQAAAQAPSPSAPIVADSVPVAPTPSAQPQN